ncbi:MAG: hypothetical protein HYY18_15145 [Planctomycetes bacterium]|nr:hypothetical protein [Planctomycetota bacterium]
MRPEKTAISGIQKLWVAMERAMFEPRPGETLVDRLKARPWNSDAPAVRKAWDDLTHPANLVALERWAAGDMNPSAREITDEALKVCRERIERAKREAGRPPETSNE